MSSKKKYDGHILVQVGGATIRLNFRDCSPAMLQEISAIMHEEPPPKKKVKKKPTRRFRHGWNVWPSDERLKAIEDQLRHSEYIRSLPPLGGWEGRPETCLLRGKEA